MTNKYDHIVQHFLIIIHRNIFLLIKAVRNYRYCFLYKMMSIWCSFNAAHNWPTTLSPKLHAKVPNASWHCLSYIQSNAITVLLLSSFHISIEWFFTFMFLVNPGIPETVICQFFHGSLPYSAANQSAKSFSARTSLQCCSMSFNSCSNCCVVLLQCTNVICWLARSAS